MNYVNALIFFFVIWMSQFFLTIDKSVSFEQHVQLQTELTEFIEGYVKQNIPDATLFKMHSLYTKPPKKGKLRAYFNYSFREPVQGAIVELAGFAVLRKIKDEPVQEWSLDAVEVSGEKVNFTEPIVITPEQPIKE